MSFDALGLSTPLVHAASTRGFGEPTPIQAAAIPAVLQGRDVLGIAQTGSGKTAAFGLPLLQMLQDARGRYPQEAPLRLRGLVLVPTRELAVQVGDVLRGLAHGLPHRTKIVVAVGGVSANPQRMALRGGADLLVATPGRLLDLLEQKALRLDAVATLVLDEADRLLDLGFAEELQRILALLPAVRQNLFFSATFPTEVDALAASILRDPERVEIVPEPGSAPAIVQRAIQVDASRRTQLLRHLVKQEGWGRALVFVATKYAAETVADKLYKNGVFATAFHGDLSQGARTQVLAELKAERWDLVITTDLAARGIDIAQLPVVVNYDLPRSAVDYVHRIGRTGRAGENGLAVSFVSAETEAHFRLIEKRQGQPVPREQVAGFEPVDVAPPAAPEGAGPRDPAAPGNGGVKGKRPSKKDKLRAAALAPADGQAEQDSTEEQPDSDETDGATVVGAIRSAREA